MKKTTYLFLAMFALMISLSACGKKAPKDLVAKKWKYSVEDMAKFLKDGYEKSVKDLPDSLKEAAKVTLDEELKALPERLSKMSVELKSDGTYTSEGPGGGKGKWTMSEDGKTLTMVEETSGEQKYDVTELSDSKLVIKQGDTTITLIPA